MTAFIILLLFAAVLWFSSPNIISTFDGRYSDFSLAHLPSISSVSTLPIIRDNLVQGCATLLLCYVFWRLYLWLCRKSKDKPESSKTKPIKIIDSGGKSPRADIVAVHGLGSNPDTTWNFKELQPSATGQASSIMGPMWLRDFLPQEGLNARIMTFNYNSFWEAQSLSMSLEDHGKGLLLALEQVRKDPEEKTRPIIFIGHSYGGIIIKQAMQDAITDRERFGEFAEQAKGFIFLGTPHDGSRLTVLGYILAAINFWRGSSTALLDEIKIGSPHNAKIHDTFTRFFNVKDTVVCFFEAIQIKLWEFPLMHVVTKESATILGADFFPLEANHKNLQRFKSRDDPDYEKIVHYIQRFIGRTGTLFPTQNIPGSKADPRPPLPVPTALTPPRNEYFYGRDAILGQIHTLIAPPTPGSDSAGLKKCVLHGLGGTGKTQIAIQYRYIHEKTYRFVFWIRAEEPTETARGFSAIARELPALSRDEVPSSNQQLNIQVALAKLCKSKEPWLLIFDNVTTVEDVTRYIPSSTSGSILITTQALAVKDLTPSRIHIQGFGEKDGSHLLLNYLNAEERRADGLEDEIEDAVTISNLVGGLPLAIAAIAGFISCAKYSLPEYIKDFDESSQSFDSWSGSGAFTQNYDKSLTTVFDIALKALTPEARSLMDCLCFMNPDQIQEDMLFRTHEDAPLRYLDISDKNQIKKLKESLYGRHLAERKPESSLSIHRFLRSYLRVKLERGSRDCCKEAFNRTFLLVRAMVPRQSATSSPSNHFWPTYERFLPHVLSLHAVFKEWETLMPELLQNPLGFAELLSDVGNYMWERYLIQDGLAVLETAERICIKLLGEDRPDPVYMQILYLQASIGLNQGSTMRADAVRKKEQVVNLRIKRLVSTYKEGDHRLEAIRLSTAYNNLACAYMHCDDYERAKPIFEKSLRIKKKWISPQYPHLPGLAEIDKNLALVYISVGKVEKALCFAAEAVRKIDLWQNGGATTKVGLAMRFISACVLFNSGSVKKALEDSKKILEAREKYLGIAHDHTLDSYYVVGMMHYTDQDLPEAERHLKVCIKLRQGYYETRIPRVLYCLSLVLDRLGREKEATERRDEARSLRDKLVPLECPGVDLNEDEMVQYDQMVNIWSGRFSGRLNIAWQKRHKS